MLNAKKAIAIAISAASVFSLASCGNNGDDESRLPEVQVPNSNYTLPLLPEGTTIEWMSYYDLNPTVGGERGTDVTLFEDVSGGKITYTATTVDKQFDDLAQAVLTNKSPDIFPYERISFPAHVFKGMYQPIDSIVDFDKPLWADMKEVAETFSINDDHYVAPIGFATSSFVFYNQRVIEDNGLDDPYELYLNNEWDWNAMETILEEYLAGDDSSDPVRKGINGWFQPQIIQSTGKTIVNYIDGVFVNNIDDPDIARAHDFMSGLFAKEYVYEGWLGNGSEALRDGNLLFYVMGEWAMDNTKYLDDPVGMVPIPRDPNNETYYSSADVFAHMWVVGSEKKDAVQAWFECRRVAETEPQYADVFKEKFLRSHNKHTEEMYQVRQDTLDPTKMVHTFDYGYGISQRMSIDDSSLPYEDGTSIMGRLVGDTTHTFEDTLTPTWTQVRASFKDRVQQEVDAANKELQNFNN